MSETQMAAPAPAPTPAPAPAPAPAAPWYEGKAAAEDIGLWQNKGWAATDPAAVALAATKAYREAAGFIGVPADRLLKLPTDPNSPDWGAVYARLGVPTDASAYDLTGVKFTDGETLSPQAQDFFRAAAVKARIPANRLTEFATDYVKFLEGTAASQQSENTAAMQVEREALQRNWGASYAANEFLAKQGATALGLTAEDVTALEGVTGYARVMEAMRRVGVLNGEDRFVSTGTPGERRVMTREGAISRISELKQDTAWGKRYLSGDREAVREMNDLHRIAQGGARG